MKDVKEISVLWTVIVNKVDKHSSLTKLITAILSMHQSRKCTASNSQ